MRCLAEDAALLLTSFQDWFVFFLNLLSPSFTFNDAFLLCSVPLRDEPAS